MKRQTWLATFGIALIIASCGNPPNPPPKPFTQQVAIQIQKFSDDMIASSVRFLKGVPLDISGAKVYLQSMLPNPRNAGAQLPSSMRPQVAGTNCGPALNSPMRLDADGDGIQANYNYTFNCSNTTYRGFAAVLTGSVKIVDQADNDPISGYDVTITNLKLAYTNANNEAEWLTSSQTTKLSKLPNGNYTVNQDFTFEILEDGVNTSYARKGNLVYTPLGLSNSNRFSKGTLNGTTDFKFTEDDDSRDYTMVTTGLRVDQSKCGQDLAVDAGELRFEYVTGDKLTWTVQDTNNDGNSCGEGVWTYNTAILPSTLPPLPALSIPSQFYENLNQSGNGIAIDSDDNMYIVGTSANGFAGVSGQGSDDLILIKLNAAGVQQWSYILGTVAGENATGVGVDATGQIYVTGYTGGDFATNTPFSFGTNVFVAKFDPSGGLTWVRQFGTNTPDNIYSNGMAVDASGNSYVVGYAYADLDTYTHAGDSDGFLVKYDSNGNKLWSVGYGGVAADEAKGVVVDSNGKVYVAGSIAGSFYTAKYDGSGTFLWSQQLTGGSSASANAIALDSFGNPYVVGQSIGSFDGGTAVGGVDVAVAKYDTAGVKQWTRQLGTTGSDSATGVVLDSSDNIFVAGTTDGGLDGNTNASNLLRDVFLIKYTSGGTKMWTKQLGTSNSEDLAGVAMRTENYAYLVGGTYGSFSSTPNSGGSDIVVLPISIYP